MEKIYRVNIDFEEQVARGLNRPINEAWEREWQYLFWWLEKNERKTLDEKFEKTYSADDLNYIKEKTGRRKLFGKGERTINWWGCLEDNGFQKSSLPSLRKAIFQDDSSYIGQPQTFPCVLKRDGSFSGKGVYFCHIEKDYQKLSFKKALVEPLRKRVQDFSFYHFEKELVFYENHLSSHGRYLGSSFYPDLSWLQNEKKALENALKIKKYLSCQNYGVDAYFFEEKGEVFLESLCEINKRRTLGSCFYKIFQRYIQKPYGRAILFTKKEKPFLKDLDSRSILRLSPLENQFFRVLLIGGESLEEIEDLRKQL